MAVIVPEDFDTSTLPHSERRVLKALSEQLDDGWYLVPSIRIAHRGQDREIDILAISANHGALVLEVKGGGVRVEGGRWFSYDKSIKNPLEQGSGAKYALLDLMPRSGAGDRSLFITHAAVLPDVIAPPGGLGPDAPKKLLIDKADLDDPIRAIEQILRRETVPPERVDVLIRTVRPNITLTVENGRYYDAAKRAIDASTKERLGAARSMDANPRVLIEGGAGTGKTWLVVDWARRALERGERTAVVCFNRPMADRLASLLAGTDAVVDTYHGLGLGLLEPFGFAAPTDAGPEFWQKAVTKELGKRARKIGTPFDTIIVDEAQDLRPKWLDSLRALLDPDGPARLLMVMDPAQAIYVDKWKDSDEFFRSTLDVNLRNSRSIGELCARLGGPPHLQDNPAGARPWTMPAISGAKELVKRVGSALDRLIADGVPPGEIAVLTSRRADRDRLLEAGAGKIALTRWEERDSGAVMCETIHRTKGLEWTAVIIATLDDPIEERLLYIGASRARMELVGVGRTSLTELFDQRR